MIYSWYPICAMNQLVGSIKTKYTMSKANQKTILFNLLAKGKNVTTSQAKAKGIKNVSAAVSQLREDGMVIWANSVVDAKTGKAVTAYRYDATRTYSAE